MRQKGKYLSELTTGKRGRKSRLPAVYFCRDDLALPPGRLGKDRLHDFRQVFQTHKVRITGTLMMDAEHVPCSNVMIKSGNHVRILVWEIHPVCAIDNL